MLVLQHGLDENVVRRRAPLASSVSQAIRDALEEGDWLTILSVSGHFEPVANLTVAALGTGFRLAWPIIIEPSQPDAQVAGMAVAHGNYFAQTDRFAADPAFAGYLATDIPVAPRPTALAYAKGVSLLAAGFSPAAAAGTPLVYGLTTPLAVSVASTAALAASLAELAQTVAYVERAPADNNDRLQFVTF